MKKLVSILVLVLMLMNALALVLPAVAAEAGMTFTANDQYKQKKTYETAPNTFEAWVKLPTSLSGRGGVILGSFDKSPCLNFEVYDNGAPRLYINSSQNSYVFDDVSLFTGEWEHVAIVRDAAAGKLYCYLNGALAQTLECTYTADLPTTHPQVLGGDSRSGNAQYFKGEIREVAVFSDARTADEIAADLNGISDGDTLLAHYDLTSIEEEGLIRDLSAGGYDCVLPTYAAPLPDDIGGKVFAADETCRTETAYAANPDTFEAMVYFSEELDSSVRGGVILGNYGRGNQSVSFEVFTGGSPRLYYTDSTGEIKVNAIFNNVNLYTGKWEHVVIVRDAVAEKLYCYLNGALAQTLDCDYNGDMEVKTPLAVGGDYRSGNSVYLRGALMMAAAYDEALSATQAEWNFEDVGAGNIENLAVEGCIALYDMTDYDGEEIIEDLTEGGYDVKIKENKIWFTDKEPVTDYAYSFAVVGDTQIICDNYQGEFHKIYDYILDNVEEKNIKFVFGLGDITNDYEESVDEWELATEHIFRMDGVVPYSLVRGNHDTVNRYNQYLPMSHYKNVIGGSYDGTMLNTWQTLTVGEIKYLIFGLDYGASDGVLNWAGEIIEEHPDHNVIITTHAYLYRDGTTLDQGDVCPPATTGGSNNGDHIWDKLIRKHENIVLVMSGHDPCDNIVMTQTEGDNGNVVTQMLIDPQGVDAAQGGAGLVAMFYISADGKTVTVDYYSTIKEKYFMSDNQFTFTLDLVEPNANSGTDNGDNENNNGADKDPDQSGGGSTVDPPESDSNGGTNTDTATDATKPVADEPKKGGCGGTLSVVSVSVAVIALAAGVSFKKKED